MFKNKKNKGLMRSSTSDVRNIANIIYSYQKSTSDNDFTQSTTISNLSKLTVGEAPTISFILYKEEPEDYTEPMDILTYELAVMNAGNSPVTNSHLISDLYWGSYIEDTARANISGVTVPVSVSYVDNNLQLSSNGMIMGWDALIYKFDVRVDIDATTVVTNHATVGITHFYTNTISNLGGFSILSNEKVLEATTILDVPVLYARLTSEKTVEPEFVYTGDIARYKLNLVNSGNLDAINTQISDYLDDCFNILLDSVSVISGDVTLVNGVDYTVTISEDNLFAASINTISPFDPESVSVSIFIPGIINW